MGQIDHDREVWSLTAELVDPGVIVEIETTECDERIGPASGGGPRLLRFVRTFSHAERRLDDRRSIGVQPTVENGDVVEGAGEEQRTLRRCRLRLECAPLGCERCRLCLGCGIGPLHPMTQDDAGLMRRELPERTGDLDVGASEAFDVNRGDEGHSELDLCTREPGALPVLGDTRPHGEALGPQALPTGAGLGESDVMPEPGGHGSSAIDRRLIGGDECGFGPGHAGGKCIEQRPSLDDTGAVDGDHDPCDGLGQHRELAASSSGFRGALVGESFSIHDLIVSNTCSICKVEWPCSGVPSAGTRTREPRPRPETPDPRPSAVTRCIRPGC